MQRASHVAPDVHARCKFGALVTLARDTVSSERFSEFERHIEAPLVREAYRFLREAGSSDPNCLLVPEGGEKQKRTIKYLFANIYPFAFIVNKNHLLFYVRKPSGRVNEATLDSLRAKGLHANFTQPKDPRRIEIAFRVVSPEEAAWALEDCLNKDNLSRLQTANQAKPDGQVESAERDRDWSDEELLAAVVAYREIQGRERAGLSGEKAQTYRQLAKKFQRTPKSFEFRMQNISAVLAILGRDWIPGLKPAKHIGSRVAIRIEKCINDLDGIPSEPRVGFELNVQERIEKPPKNPPNGQAVPQRTVSERATFSRDAGVKAWVLNRAKGACECCRDAAPFVTSDGVPYLEVHHLRTLADGGSDTVANAVALCPNCHRRMHYAPDARQLKQKLIESIEGLKFE